MPVATTLREHIRDRHTRPKADPHAPKLAQIEREARDHCAVACSRLLKIKPKDQPLIPFTHTWPQRHITETYLQPAWDAKQLLGLLTPPTPVRQAGGRTASAGESWGRRPGSAQVLLG